jgi:Tfp pilus assembly protein PilF
MIWLAMLSLGVSLAQQNYDLANELFRQGQLSQAADALNLSLKENPAYLPGWTLRGKIAMAYDRFDYARAAFRRAVSLDPNSAYAQFMLGFFYYVDNDFSNAAPVLDRARQLDPDNPRVLLYQALSQEGLAHPDLAESLYQKTIALETRLGRPNPETHTAYGRLLFTLNRYEESARQVACVLQLDPHSRDGRYEAGRLAFERDDYTEAAQNAEKALVEPGSGTLDRQIHFLLTRAYSKLGDTANAERHRKQFEASPPTLRR